jgi:hypothetical protein
MRIVTACAMETTLTKRDASITRAPAWALVVTFVLSAGCSGGKFSVSPPGNSVASARPEPAEIKVPAPLHLLLPKAIKVHPFTGTRTFDEAGGVKGIDVRVEALDAYGDATKAFGKFQFALYQYQSDSPSPRGPRVATWEEDLLDPEKNLVHWDAITRAYAFKLQWYRAIPVGQKFILAVDFSSPFTARKFAERVFVSGQ